jgi:hypothetical protein
VPLTAWWVLLFGMSIFARYDPGLWNTTLNLDRSGRAVSLRLLLDEALRGAPGSHRGRAHRPGELKWDIASSQLRLECAEQSVNETPRT